ncbi:MAG: DNA gyrase C-terminal beta-propeller domain-containing protein, partial [Anaerolineaceae bacterium]|nr:DNA gyrase C-terminal beta-propeller domain-containing protein [Anaerolineaceae bacterium]
GREGILQMYSTGRGRLVLRGVAHIEEIRGGRYAIVITEIPYQVNKTTLIERIAELARGGKIDAISDLRDESDRRGMSIVIELKRGAQPRKVLNQLYKFTPLQSTFGAHLLALVDGEPRPLTLKRALQVFIDHRQQVITRRTQFELEKARRRAHILKGLLIALANLDEVIETIRRSPDAEAAKTRLMSRFELDEVQAQAILDLQLRRLAALERKKIEDEQRETLARIAALEDLLAHPKKILTVIKADLKELSEKYGDERRTRIAAEATEEISEEDLVADESSLISITQRGYIKRVSPSVYRTRGRGGRGVSGQTVRGEDEILMLLNVRTLNTILFFSDRGKVYSEKAYQIPDANRTDRGIPIVNLLTLDPTERITAAVAVSDFDATGYCTMATSSGRVKRVPLSEFASVRNSGLIAINLDVSDELDWVRVTNGQNDIILVTEGGKALRFAESAIRPMGRQAAGVTGIRLAEGDRLTSMEVIEPGGFLLTATTLGYGKCSRLKEYPVKGRATRGVATINQRALARIGKIAAARVVQPEDEVTLITTAGMVLRLKVKAISIGGRATRGFRLMNLHKGDSVVALARMAAADQNVGLEAGGNGGNEQTDSTKNGS